MRSRVRRTRARGIFFFFTTGMAMVPTFMNDSGSFMVPFHFNAFEKEIKLLFNDIISGLYWAYRSRFLMTFSFECWHAFQYLFLLARPIY